MSYKTGYQGGPYFELLSTQGKDSAANWKISSSGIKKIYEKEVKGYVYTLEGAPATTKLQTPKDQKQSLTLVQRFLVIQIHVAKGADFSIELGVSDLSNNKRRILLSTSLKETQVTPLHAKVPLTIVKRAVWLNLVLDMVSLVGETWTSQTFRSVDQISISANCKLRRVFTMKSQPPDTTDDDEMYGCSSTNSGELDNIPKQCQLAPDVVHSTQILTLNKIKCAERFKAGKGLGIGDQFRPGSTLDLDLSASGRKLQSSDGKIAFGSKAPRAPPDTGRRTARQGSITTRSLKSQISRQDSTSSNNNNSLVPSTSDSINSRDGIIATAHDHFDFPKPRPPASASTISSSSGAASSSLYNRQQSEPVTQEDYGFIGINGLGENQIAPHPPREPSNDRFKRRPRIRSMGPNGVLNKGEPSMISPPTSALVSNPQPGSRSNAASQQSQGQSTVSPGTARINQRMEGSRGANSNKMRDSGVGPDVPEIQSPRKGDPALPEDSTVFTEYDSLADVISLLRSETSKLDGLAEERDRVGRLGDATEDPSKELTNGWRLVESQESRVGGSAGSEGGRVRRQKEASRREDPGRDREAEDNDSNLSTSASESSHPGEYEESDEESSETNKLHLFISPPKSAPRRNISPSTTDQSDANQSKKSFVKSFRSNIKRGARLEDDFVSRSSSEEDLARQSLVSHHHPHHHHHHHHHHYNQHQQHQFVPSRRQGSGGNSSHRNSTSGYNSSNYTTSSVSFASTTSSKVRSQDRSSISKSRPMAPKTSNSPDQKPTYDSRLYSDYRDSRSRNSVKGSVSRMSKKSLREIDNPHNDSLPTNTQHVAEKKYDVTRYQMEDLTESFERRMFASMQRQTEEALEDISPPRAAPQHTAHRSSQHTLSTGDVGTHLYSESPATTSDDDTSFSTWKAPAPNQAPHNYQDEMKSRRSSDTLTSSNPRDWSGIISPPIEPALREVQDLQGTLEGTLDELPDDLSSNKVQSHNGLKSEDEEEKLDLIFDPKLNCYHDPKTQKWYELKS